MAGPVPAPPSLMAHTYTEEDLLRWMEGRTLEMSDHGLSEVHSMRLFGDILVAEVKIPAKYSYRVEIDLAASLRHPRSLLRNRCSCPLSHDCMHVAAVLAQMLQQIDHTPPSPTTAARCQRC